MYVSHTVRSSDTDFLHYNHSEWSEEDFVPKHLFFN